MECGPLEVYGSEVALCIVVHRWKAGDKNLLPDLELGLRVYSYFGKIIELQILRKVYQSQILRNGHFGKCLILVDLL